jgi:uncharacterized protein (TIGR02145 family)
MKKIISICSALIFAFTVSKIHQANAQDYHITFAASGVSESITTVEVENQTTGKKLSLSGGDILHLTSAVGISQPEEIILSGMRIYPNPMTDNSIIALSPPEAGDAVITVYEITGKTVAQVQTYLEKNMQEFRLWGLKNGLYLVSVCGNTYKYIGKLLCNGIFDGNPGIEKVSNTTEFNIEKKSKKELSNSQATVDMHYFNGEILKFKGISGNLSTIKTGIPTQDELLTFNFILCTDGDNNNYSVIDIGSQTWMAENLRTTRYNDGTTIPSVIDNAEWINLSTPAYCWYNNDSIANKDTNGALYNWFTVNTEILCPYGWHIPGDDEWKTLELSLGMSQEQADTSGPRGTDQGTQLKSISGWIEGGVGNGTNSCGFNALPAGLRPLDNGEFNYFGNTAVFWSSTEIFGDGAICRSIWLEENTVRRAAEESYYLGKVNGYSVRCVKNSSRLR